jgi:DinB superfamily
MNHLCDDDDVDFSLEMGKAVLTRTPGTLRALLANLPDAWTLSDEGPNTWSPYQVVGHMTHIEEVDWMDRTIVILAQREPRTFDPVDREAGFAKFQGWSMNNLLDRFDAVRSSNLDQLDALVSVSDLELRGVHPTFGEVPLSQLLATWAVHDLNHLNQIVKTMAKQYTEAIGPWRSLLPIVDVP